MEKNMIDILTIWDQYVLCSANKHIDNTHHYGNTLYTAKNDQFILPKLIDLIRSTLRRLMRPTLWRSIWLLYTPGTYWLTRHVLYCGDRWVVFTEIDTHRSKDVGISIVFYSRKIIKIDILTICRSIYTLYTAHINALRSFTVYCKKIFFKLP